MNILSDIFGATVLRNVTLVIVLVIVLLNVGLAWWAYRDMVSRNRNVVLHILVILLTLIGGVFGFVLYVLVRPMQTLADAEIERMEMELLSTELSEMKRPAAKKEKKNV